MATYNTILKFYFICQCELIHADRQRHWLGGSKGAIMTPLSTYSLLSLGSPTYKLHFSSGHMWCRHLPGVNDQAKGIFETKTPELSLKKIISEKERMHGSQGTLCSCELQQHIYYITIYSSHASRGMLYNRTMWSSPQLASRNAEPNSWSCLGQNFSRFTDRWCAMDC